MSREIEILREWIVDALKSYGGAATMIDVPKWTWENHREDLEKEGDLFYRWQYAMGWAGTALRQDGILGPANQSDRGIWVLS